MKISTSYPYPVLYMNNDDYTDSSFHTTIDVAESFGEVRIAATFELINQEIQRLIEEKQCAYLLHLECGQTSYRNVFPSESKRLEIAIPSNKLRGKVTIHSYIIANEKIATYTNASFNDWFQGLSFTLEKGNIVAIGEAIEMNLFEDNTELLDLPSIVTIRKSLKKEYMEVDIHSDNITIELPEYEYNQYAANSKSRLKNTILAAVIVPSLVYVFSKIPSNREDLEGYTWYQVLEKIFADNQYRLEDVGTDSLSALKAAQLVLRKPYKACFEEIEKISRGDE
ncbi:hypothetical protein OEV98_15125 [Caldibacillus lycopersici]|uniref:Uncharacterized protein n=1 Tax=Perspicuibacillus lycopersici TaxID=1325689 RepID=A0AAE3LNL9_9BACI|nr:hypothetical protein [Perspicuibacillus lycopersici]MCU9614875.1 hypothetical protein [Perspicuibacillus lycopersici]